MTDDSGIHVTAQASLVAFAALAVGLTDAALIAAGHLGATGAFAYVPQRVWAAAPLCWVGVAVVFALLVYPPARHRGGAWTAIALVALLVAVRLHGQPARLLVAGGTALVLAAAIFLFCSRWWTRRPRPAGAAAAAAAWIAVIVAASEPGETPRRFPASPAAASPDVIVIFLDTVPYDLIRRGGRHEMYDLLADPAEERDLSAHPLWLSVLRKRSIDLDRARSLRVDPRESGFRSLGYVR